MHAADWIIIAVIAVCLVFALADIKKHKGRCIGCSGDCEHCAYKNEKKGR